MFSHNLCNHASSSLHLLLTVDHLCVPLHIKASSPNKFIFDRILPTFLLWKTFFQSFDWILKFNWGQITYFFILLKMDGFIEKVLFQNRIPNIHSIFRWFTERCLSVKSMGSTIDIINNFVKECLYFLCLFSPKLIEINPFFFNYKLNIVLSF